MGILKAKKGRSSPLPDDSLTSDVLASKFYGQIGLPDNSDSLAYDPVQRLIAVRLLLGSLFSMHMWLFKSICT
jgi:hypothetical protein